MVVIETSRLTVRTTAKPDDFTFVTSPAAVKDKIQASLKIQPAKTYATLIATVNEDGGTQSIGWTLNNQNQRIRWKIPANRLFPLAPDGSNILIVAHPSAFDFEPSSYHSDWTSGSQLDIKFMKTNKVLDGMLSKEDIDVFGGRTDFAIRASIQFSKDLDVGELSVSAIPYPLETVKTLPGFLSPGLHYPGVGLYREKLLFAPWSKEGDGLPLKPLWTSVADTTPIIDAQELVAAARNLLASPTIPATAERAEFDAMIKKQPGPEVGPVDAEYSWPPFAFNQADLDDAETGGENVYFTSARH